LKLELIEKKEAKKITQGTNKSRPQRKYIKKAKTNKQTKMHCEIKSSIQTKM
jgi:hypothetical protein